MTAAGIQEAAFTFRCADAALLGILHRPPAPARRGVLIVVGGPQYRVGSHRQFLLLARHLAAQGFPAMRFDHRGIGDSEGDYRGFEALEADLAAAIDAFFAHCPALQEVVLWGLCDAASAILFSAHRDPRVTGLVLLNPWVRTVEGEARAYLRHYYLQRLANRDFWSGLMRGKVRPGEAAAGLATAFTRSRGLGRRAGGSPAPADGAGDAANPARRALPARMAQGLQRFAGPVLLIVSGRDLTAREFEDAAARSALWRRLLAAPRMERRVLPAADHTFSRRAWRDSVAGWTADWMRGW